MQWLFELLQSSAVAFWVLLPAGAANMAPILAAKIPGLNKLSWPISKDLFGENKTWRGLAAGITAGILAVWLQRRIGYPSVSQPTLVLGFLFGMGALLGDAAESFVKRRLGIEPGKPFRPWDQIDYVIGVALLFGWTLPIGLLQWGVVLLVYGLASWGMSTLGRATGFKRDI